MEVKDQIDMIVLRELLTVLKTHTVMAKEGVATCSLVWSFQKIWRAEVTLINRTMAVL